METNKEHIKIIYYDERKKNYEIINIKKKK
jgi:hypothetical protein